MMPENECIEKLKKKGGRIMPCDTITTVSLNMSNINIETMKAALEALGYKVNVDGNILYGNFGEIDTKRGTMNINRYDKGWSTRRGTAQSKDI